ncbi:LysR substrate-binding domain-containing protein [Shewanella sp. SR44-3]|uniref:LysR substrate-binding domain-containing protein n=1 Tax=Shewanella sp. SR44-3 TaxID=2760936 RepID=UPI0015FE4BC9|nr:LysR substrate-binding domain-containing protein [Shewanella sp. SR44-3]MBB1270476.1 LysR family transcriptional regulator [Shewanella sp. SR44-3]
MSQNLRSMDLNLLPIFDCLMCEQHLSRAAEVLAMSQPAVSNALKRLRLHYNDALFIRSAKGLIPTARAMELHLQIQPALQQLQLTQQSRDFDPKFSHGNISIAMEPTVEYLMAPSWFSCFHQQAPNMRLALYPEHLDNIAERLRRGQLDFAIDYLGFDEQYFQQQRLADEALVVICAKQHHLLKGSISLAQFESLPQVTLVPRPSTSPVNSGFSGSPIEHLIAAQWPNPASFTRNIVLSLSSFVAIPAVIAQSELIAVVPKRLAEQGPWQQQLQCLPLPFAGLKTQLNLIWHNSREQDPMHQWAREQLCLAV